MMTVHKKKLRIPHELAVFLYKQASVLLLPVLPTHYVCLVLKYFTAVLLQYQQKSNVIIFLTEGKKKREGTGASFLY